MFELPKIRIEVENMKYQIIHAFSTHNDEIEKAVEEQLTKAIAEYPFESEINKVAVGVITDVIKDSLLDYFRYGPGRVLINDVVLQALGGLIKRT